MTGHKGLVVRAVFAPDGFLLAGKAFRDVPRQFAPRLPLAF